MMLNLELFTELGDHCVIEIFTIVSNNSLWDTISIDQIVLDELCHDVLGYCSKRRCLNPLREIINSYQNEMIYYLYDSCMNYLLPKLLRSDLQKL